MKRHDTQGRLLYKLPVGIAGCEIQLLSPKDKHAVHPSPAEQQQELCNSLPQGKKASTCSFLLAWKKSAAENCSLCSLDYFRKKPI